jgi:hypothetical protein
VDVWTAGRTAGEQVALSVNGCFHFRLVGNFEYQKPRFLLFLRQSFPSINN